MAGHFTNLLQQVVDDAEIRLAKLDMLSAEERRQILVDFNDTTTRPQNLKTVIERFEEQVAKTPDRVALVFENEELTYREFNRRANQVAHDLRQRGIGENTVVGLMAQRSFEMMVGLYGILKAGAAYVPIDPEYPEDRIRYLLDDSQTPLVLTQRHLQTNVTHEEKEIVAIEDLLERSAWSGENLGLTYDPARIMYLLYTSGSTGKPKGVQVRANAFANLIDWFTSDQYEITDQDNILLIAPISFDLAQKNLYASLVKGGTLCLFTPGLYDYNLMLQTIKQQRITFVNCTPSAFQPLVDFDPEFKSLQTLRCVYFGGEPLNPAFLKPWARSGACNAQIVNAYGPTECTAVVTSYKLDPQEVEQLKSVPIGKPIRNANVYVLDQNKQLLPVGTVGEIYIGGVGVSAGYFNRPELTAERFVTVQPDGEEPQLLYRTGDVGKWLSDGNLEFLGRVDHQVKIRGFRIELGEIEAELLTHEHVKEAIVSAKGDENDSYLCAYLVADRELSGADLKAYLSENLPDYMIPPYFVQLDKLPLTPNGKIDRHALPEPDKAAHTEVEYVAPSDEIEAKLVDIFQQVLNVQGIGTHHDFFELGGHSLKATVLLSKIHKELQAQLSLREVFQNATVKELAKRTRKAEASIYEAIRPVEEKEFYPASSAQKRLYMLEQIQEAGTSYNMPGAMLVEGALDTERLEAAFQQLVRRHQTLRTSFEMVGAEIVQRVHPNVDLTIRVQEGAQEREDEWIAEFVRPFDLSQAPLLRVGLIRYAEDRHLLLFDMHHIISDGVSMALLIEEFVRLYGGDQLSPLRIQYTDYSVWQQEWLASQAIQAEEKYWLDTFAGEIPVLNLMTDYPRSTELSMEGSRIHFELGRELTGKLNALAKETGTTLYMVLLAAYNALLSRYTGQDDIVVGSPIAGRPHVDLQDIIGMFVNTLAMRNYPTGEQTFAEFLQSVKENALQAYEHQGYPFEQLVEKLEIPRDLSRNPLFDTMFVLQNTERGQLDVSGLRFTPCSSDHGVTKFDLTVTAQEVADRIEFDLEYRTKLFKQETIERMAGHLVNILQQVADDADVKLTELDLLSDAERQQILHDFNRTATEYPGDKPIHVLFEEQAERWPDQPAVAFGDRQLTYRELNSRANRLAALLRAKGVQADQVVGVIAPRSIELTVGILGVLKAGGAYLPIDPKLPEERIAYMLEDSGSRVLLTLDHLQDTLSFNGDVIALDGLGEDGMEHGNLETLTKPTDLVYVIYTSGSTGKPKGVMIEQKSLVNFVYTMYDGFGREIGPGDKGLSVATIIFDANVYEFFLPLTFGACLVLYENVDFVDPKELGQTIAEQEITLAYIPPSLLKEVNETLRSSDRQVVLDKLMVGVEPIKDQVFEDYLALNNSMKILNAYGPTEATVVATYYPYQSGTVAGKNVSIGKPVANTRILILNADRLVPVGVVGELCIAGDGLARGYLNRPDLTAEKFVSSPYGDERMYKTGDLARWLPDGNIEFLGRSDFQVKMRGYRIELGEIESSLEDLAGIRKAVVVAWTDETRGMYLAAYVSHVEDQQPYTVEALREHLAQRLPTYMIPLHFLVMDQIPLTPNGKVDRKNLPRPTVVADVGTGRKRAYNEVEAKLAPLWFELLGQEPSDHDDFFESGGHSLLVMRLVTRIQETFNVKISARDVFANSSFESLSRLLGTAVQTDDRSQHLLPIQKAEQGTVEFPLSYAQQRMWFLDQLNPGSSNYNIVGAYKITGAIDPARLETVFCEIARRHAILRTTFGVREGVPYQLVGAEPRIGFRSIEMPAEQDVNSLIMEEARVGFDLAQGPLLRLLFIRNEDPQAGHVLVVNMHHIVSDGWSMNVLVGEFGELWRLSGEQGGDLTQLPQPDLQYGDYSLWQRDLFNTGYFTEQVAYWQQHLGGHKGVLELPTDKPRSTSGVGRAGEVEVRISESELSQLKQLAQTNGCTLYMVLFAAYAIVLQRYSGEDDIVIGTAVANRSRSELEGLIGFFANTLGIRIDLSEDVSLTEYLERVQKAVLDGFANEDVPFDVVVDEVNVPRVPGVHPLFQAMFILQTASPTDISVQGLEITPVHLPMEEAKFDLFLNLEEVQGELVGHLKFNQDLFHEGRIRKLGDYLTSLLGAWVKNPDKKLSELKATIQGERQAKPVLSPQELRDLMAKLK
ncbi:MAG TPA: amino acid adenylation domain-containing protein [Bacilli bacterium]|nr:amino acid adenylation domain-containing protein [Bacilli bacterium]